MKKSILFSVLVVGATLLQAQSITVHQTCGQNGLVLVIANGHECVDLDLPSGTLWATCNVGATTPEGYGDYFAWGETVTKETYSWSTYFDTNDGGNTFTKYNNEGGKTVLDPEDDAAHVNWGGSWRMPTKAEWQELRYNCTWKSTRQNGIYGYKVTSKKAGYTDKFIFLPAAGVRDGSDLRLVGSYGGYQSSSLYENLNVWLLYFWTSNFLDLSGGGDRYEGTSVRPVLQPSSISYSLSANDTIRIYSNGCDDYQTFIGPHGGQLTMSANSDPLSHFVQWNDGNTDNPRTITTNGNADYTAYFETPNFSVQVQSNDAARGSGYISKVVKGDTLEYNDSVGSFEAGSEVFLAHQANYGYHFDKWSDGNPSQQRSFILTQDTTFTATFAKNVYSITKNAEHGSISGNSSAEYLDFVTLTVTPDYGYHFTKWSDGNTDNPRIAQITQDTTFTAEFAYARVGTCGKDLALTWSYDHSTKVLTIGNAGEFTENMQFGVEAPGEMEELVIGNSVTAIGANAFSGIETLKKVSIGESVKTIGEQAFYNCVNLETIFNYRPTPTNAYSTAFDGVDKFECSLYVLPSSIDMYKAAAVWQNFYYILPIEGDQPVGPTEEECNVMYITQDGDSISSEAVMLHLPVAPEIEGFTFVEWRVVEGSLSMGITIQAVYEANELSSAPEVYTNPANPAQKLIRNGNVYILTDDKIYSITGQEVR